MRVAVIGGGVYGAATAYFLTKHGVDDVILFEKNHIGSGSTGYSAGIIRHHYSNRTQIELAIRGREIISDFERYVGADGGYHQNGYLILYRGERAQQLREVVERQRKLGLKVCLLESEELDQHLPGITPPDDVLGAYEREAGFADPYLIATGFANKAQEQGTTILTDQEVVNLVRTGDRIERLETTAESYDVDYVVNAAGPAGAAVGAMAGVELPLQICESKIVALTSSTEYDVTLPTLSDHTIAPDMYVKPEPSGEFIVGGIDRPVVGDDGRKEGVSEDFLMEVADRLECRLPRYADASVVDSWSAYITVTPDSHLIVGEPKGLANFYTLVGGSGHGFKTAPAFAEAAAKEITGVPQEYDLSKYHLSRFETDETLTGVSVKTYSTEH